MANGATTTMTEEELQEAFEFALSMVRKGGELVREAISKRDKAVQEKDSQVDLVTETDRAVEKLLFDGLRAKYPHHCFIGEESTAAAAGSIGDFTNAPTWIIDPIDGTMNFVHSNPMVSISVGMTVNRRAEIGIVYLPAYDQMYAARKGKGATLNGKTIKVTGCDRLSKAMLIFELWASSGDAVTENHSNTVKSLLPKVQALRSIGFFVVIQTSTCDRLSKALLCLECGGQFGRKMEANVANVVTALNKAHALRWIGSAAIDLVMVAAGQADAYFHCGIHCWDIVAGAIIVREAGGTVTDPDGSEFDFMSRRILVASTNKLAAELSSAGLKYLEFDREHPDPCPL